LRTHDTHDHNQHQRLMKQQGPRAKGSSQLHLRTCETASPSTKISNHLWKLFSLSVARPAHSVYFTSATLALRCKPCTASCIPFVSATVKKSPCTWNGTEKLQLSGLSEQGHAKDQNKLKAARILKGNRGRSRHDPPVSTMKGTPSLFPRLELLEPCGETLSRSTEEDSSGCT